MKKIIWLELGLLFASILIFRSVWMFLDRLAWTGSGLGLGGLLIIGLFMAVYALIGINRSN